MSRFVQPIPLVGPHWVSLEPLGDNHIPEIAAAAADGDVGALWFTGAPSPDTAAAWVRRMTAMQDADEGVTYVIRRRTDGVVVGSSSLFHVDAANRRLEIGHTWYSASARRTGVNTETKLVMLSHAFDDLGCVAVEFRTHFFNQASRAAIERLGAKLDGILRSHQLLPDGSRRDTEARQRRGALEPEVGDASGHREPGRVAGEPERDARLVQALACLHFGEGLHVAHDTVEVVLAAHEAEGGRVRRERLAGW